MRRDAQNVLLLLAGVTLTKTTLNGTYLRYVKEGLYPLLLASGILIIALAVIAIARDIARPHVSAHTSAHGHHHSSVPYWAFLAPVAVLLFLSPPALGAHSVGSSTIRATPPAFALHFDPLPDGTPNVPIFEVVQRSVNGDTLDGRDITVTGFVLREEGTTSVARISIICCAADARRMSIRLDTDADGAFGWVEITGVVEPGSATQDNGYSPRMRVAAVELIDEPRNPYSY